MAAGVTNKVWELADMLDVAERLHMRRFTRLTNAHSKKLENHEHAIALHFFYYNFCKIHQTLRCTPAMAAGITNKAWKLADMLDVAERLAA